jgi:DNA-binding CsgD family transcriptional regulator
MPRRSNQNSYREFLDSIVAFDKIDTPMRVLDALHNASMRMLRLPVLGAGRFPLKPGDWKAVEKGKNVFVHKSVPPGWFDQYLLTAPEQDDMTLLMAELGLAPYTWGESRRLLAPIGIDQWPYELALKYGIRDAFLCPVGRRWIVGFWSRKVLTESFDERARAMLFLGASFAAIRLEALVSPDPRRVGMRAALTARELAVLRLSSRGRRLKEIAAHLALGEETVRSHFKNAQQKLGAKSQVHAVAEAITLHLMP